MPRAFSLVALVLAVFSSAAFAGDAGAFRTIAVQDGGRLKPLDTFARETARRVGGARAFGAESMAGLEPSEWLLAMMAEPEAWKDVEMIRVTQADLRTSLGLPAGRDRFSFRELVANRLFMDSLSALEKKTSAAGDVKLTPSEEALSSLYGTLNLLAGVFSLEALKLVPPSPEVASPPTDAWLSLHDSKATALGGKIELRMSALLAAYHSADPALVDGAARVLAGRLRQTAPAQYPTEEALGREVRYNQLKPFRLAWLLYLVGAVLVLASIVRGTRPVVSLIPIVLGWAIHTYGLALRTQIAGRAPVTNMYESVVFVAWGAVLFALLLEWRQRTGHAVAAAAVLAVACLVIADSVPIMDGAIAPLVPVLRDNFWLTTHVLTITLGYAAFLLAAGLAHVSLGVWFVAPQRMNTSSVPKLLYRALQAGTLLLAAGTLLGGVWASYSWGRFWGWDPKETWALIALLGYLSLLHGRSAGLLRDFGLAVGSVVAFLGVLMAWYGVNFILGTGLHSYGFGAGGYGYVAAFTATELAIAGSALLTWRKRNPARAAVPTGAVVHS